MKLAHTNLSRESVCNPGSFSLTCTVAFFPLLLKVETLIFMKIFPRVESRRELARSPLLSLSFSRVFHLSLLPRVPFVGAKAPRSRIPHSPVWLYPYKRVRKNQRERKRARNIFIVQHTVCCTQRFINAAFKRVSVLEINSRSIWIPKSLTAIMKKKLVAKRTLVFQQSGQCLDSHYYISTRLSHPPIM